MKEIKSEINKNLMCSLSLPSKAPPNHTLKKMNYDNTTKQKC